MTRSQEALQRRADRRNVSIGEQRLHDRRQLLSPDIQSTTKTRSNTGESATVSVASVKIETPNMRVKRIVKAIKALPVKNPGKVMTYKNAGNDNGLKPNKISNWNNQATPEQIENNTRLVNIYMGGDDDLKSSLTPEELERAEVLYKRKLRKQLAKAKLQKFKKSKSSTSAACCIIDKPHSNIISNVLAASPTESSVTPIDISNLKTGDEREIGHVEIILHCDNEEKGTHLKSKKERKSKKEKESEYEVVSMNQQECQESLNVKHRLEVVDEEISNSMHKKHISKKHKKHKHSH